MNRINLFDIKDGEFAASLSWDLPLPQKGDKIMLFKREYPVLQVGDESAHTPTSLNFLLALDILRNRVLRYMSDT